MAEPTKEGVTKNDTGTFVVESVSSEGNSIASSAPPTLEGRLEKISEVIQVKPLTTSHEPNKFIPTGTIDGNLKPYVGPQSLKNSQSVQGAPVPQSTQSTQSFQSVPGTLQAVSPEVQNEVLVQNSVQPGLLPMQAVGQPFTGGSQSSTFHTISGGPETVQQNVFKNANDIAASRKYSTLGMSSSKDSGIEEIGPSLFAVLFKFTIFTVLFFLGLSAASPKLLQILVEKQILRINEAGLYMYDQFTFSNVFLEHPMYNLVLILVISFVFLLLALVADFLTGKSMILFVKFFIHLLLVLVTGVGIFYLQINGVDILGMIDAQLATFK
jgi:hypothetical protein